MNWWDFVYRPSAAERRRKALRESQRFAKAGGKLAPVVVEGRTIARSFWGKAWCENLESYRDFENRLPRGRSYLRNRAVLDLKLTAGKIAALVCGTDLYKVTITIKPLPQPHWARIKKQCAGEIGSLIELLEGRLSERVMRVVTNRGEGLFPKPCEIQMQCSCPDWATMCKHIAAVMYGIGAQLDHEPELLFTVRNVNHSELVSEAPRLEAQRSGPKRKRIAQGALGEVFGIELEPSATIATRPHRPRARKPNAGRRLVNRG